MVDYLYNLPNSTDLDEISTDIITITPSLSGFFLFVVFLLFFIGGSTRQKIRTGTADYSAWAVVGSVAMWLLALIMSVRSGFIQFDWLIISVVISIGSATWFFLDRKVSEI